MLKPCFVLFGTLLAFEGLAEEKRTYSGKILVGDSSEYTYSNSSEANRQPLRIAIGAAGSFGQGRYSAFYYLNPDLAFELSNRSTRDTIEEDFDDWEKNEKSIGISANFFMKDGWFFRVGLLNRHAVFKADRYSYDSVTDDYVYTHDVRVSQHDVAGELAIGSQWQWSSFYFGFDWISYEHRLSKLNSSTSITVKNRDMIRMNYAERDIEQGRIADNDLNRKNAVMNARIGWSF